MLPYISFHQSTSILPIADRDRPVGDIRGPDPRRASGDVPFIHHSHTDPARQQVPMDILYFHDDLSFCSHRSPFTCQIGSPSDPQPTRLLPSVFSLAFPSTSASLSGNFR